MSSRKLRIVLSGYGSWLRAPVNPSTVVIENLKLRDWPDLDIRFVHMAVDSEQLYVSMNRVIREFQPDAWVGIGVSGRTDAIQLETLAINKRHFIEVPDVNGFIADQLRVFEQGPLALEANFPSSLLVEKLNQAGFAAKLSFSAGTHLCNQMLYTGNYLAQKLNQENQQLQKMLCGFVHIPFIEPPKGDALNYIDTPKTMDEQTLTDAVALLVSELHKQLQVNKVE
ncbi:hypothetical protein [Reinekea thalattae]|uniref:Pyrrolidone-carboxylate peptidase n=1 Tax=Reinekea thalattae TaxID=2593301 RepID=A0A5C8Z772_9GAMM|nr:hypothetical protein [Reinekea thalattae]TXR53487.1 hypothetical protein FME95_02660 [Reinekea thalattae]